MYSFCAEARANYRRFDIMLLRMKHAFSIELGAVG